jgi:type 2 lantibiotic biosynthesis protein LanM
MKGLRVLSRPTHGWVEYVKHTPCQTQEEVQHYYRRVGQLVCLFYVLQASDMHYENIVACGEYPIPIDLETIMTPRAISLLQDTAMPAHGEQRQNAIGYSVYQSTLLPMKLPVQGKSLDLSFLGCITGFESPYEAPCWKDINTDAMRVVSEVTRIEAGKNAVVLDGTLMRSSDHLEEIVTGFRTMYNLLAKYRDDLLTPWGPLVPFMGCPLRYIFRSTFIYEKLLARIAHPNFLCDGVDRWIEMQVLKRPLLKNKVDPRFWTIVDAEVRALQRLDVPSFKLLPEGNDLLSDEGVVIENFFDRSALDHVRACLTQLSVEDLERQVDFIRDTFVDTSVIPAEASTK